MKQMPVVHRPKKGCHLGVLCRISGRIVPALVEIHRSATNSVRGAGMAGYVSSRMVKYGAIVVH